MNERQKIITALDTQLKRISVANGFQTALGSSVEEWRVLPWEESDLPALSYRDTGAELVESDNFYAKKKLNLEVSITVSGSTTLVNIRKTIGDVLEALDYDRTLGGYAYMIEYDGDTIEINHEDNIFGEVVMRFGIYYRTKLMED